MSAPSSTCLRRLGVMLGRFRRDCSGAIAVMAAAFMSVAVVLAALGVDVGMLYLERRQAQNVTDLAAIAAAVQPDRAEEATRVAFEDNGYGAVVVRSGSPDKDEVSSGSDTGRQILWVQKGHYAARPEIAPDARFRPGAMPFNAVKVAFRKPGSLYFGHSIIAPPVIQTTGVAHSSAAAAFSIGSRLLRLNEGLLNAVLNGLLGTSVSLTVMDYNALIDANISVMPFLDLIAGELDLTAVSYNELLKADISFAQLAGTMAELTDGTAAGAANKLASDRHAGNVSFALGDILDLGRLGDLSVGAGGSTFEAHLGVMELLTAAAAAANGQSQVSFDLGFTVPGAASLTAILVIGEPPQRSPWFTVGEGGEVVRTAQTRMFLEAIVGGSGALAGEAVRLPIYLEVAYAEAQLMDVSCPTGRLDSVRVEIDARPGIFDLRVADLNPGSLRRFETKPQLREARLVDLPLIKVSGQAQAGIGNSAMSRLVFNYTDIQQLSPKSVSTRQFSGPLVGSLLGNLDLDVKVAGLGLALPGPIESAVMDSVRRVAEPLDEAVHSLLAALGIKVGEADVRVHGANCQRAVLVQ